MPNSADVLSWSTLTPAVNEMKPPQSALKNDFFSRNITVPTRNIELSVLRRGRRIAPFVKRNGAAIMTLGHNEEFKVVKPAHIRVKRPLNPAELLDKRRAGSVIFPGADGVAAAMREFMAIELSNLMDDVSNSEEYLCAQAIRGIISYSSQDQESFEVNFGRSADHSVVLAGADLWTDAASKPSEHFLEAAQLINRDVQGTATDVILGKEAREAFLKNVEVRDFWKSFGAFLQIGQISLSNQIDPASGMLLLGVFAHQIRVWSYERQLTLPDGSAFDLIRPKFAEFLWRSPAAQMVTYYGAIEDMRAIGAGRVLQSQRFSKSWEEEDPSARMLLVESNPLPCLRRPDATVSMQVVA